MSQPGIQGVLVMSPHKEGRGKISARVLTFFGLSLAQSGEDWKEALREEEEYERKVTPIHRVNLQKHSVFIRKEAFRQLRIRQAKENHRRDWAGRESIRKQCIHPLQDDYSRLYTDNKVKVKKLIMMMATRRVFPKRSNRTPSYQNVLIGKETVSDWFSFPWQTIILIVRFYILALRREQQEQLYRENIDQNIRRVLRQKAEQEWWRTSGHICDCWHGHWSRNYDDDWECDCYQDHLEMLYSDELERQDIIEDALDRDYEHRQSFPLGEIGEESRNSIDRSRRKAQKGKPRHRPLRKFRARGGRSGKCRFLQQMGE